MRRILQSIILTSFLLAPLPCRSANSAAGTGEIDSYKSYKIYSADPDLIVSSVKELIGKDRKVFFDKLSSQLMVIAKTNEHQMVEMLLKDINIVPMNVQIDVSFSEGAEESNSGIDVGGKVDIIKHPNRTTTDIVIKPQVHNELADTSSSTRQTLLVLSGREANLLVGQEVPYLERIIEFGRNWGYIKNEVKIRNVGAFLNVHPQVIGNGPYINIKITPEISGLVDSKTYRIKYTRAETEATVYNGQTINIGGLQKDSNFYDTFLVGYNKQGKKTKLDISLTARIIPATKPSK
jgi:hypothetical protein